MILLLISSSTLHQLLTQWGYAIVFVFVALESTGIPVPGETMLIAAAVYAGSGHLSIAGVIAAAAVGAIIGDNLGYLAGRYGGEPLLRRYGRYIHIGPEQLSRAQVFFDRYGDWTVFFGRFVAVLRAWAAFLAGVNEMPWGRFFVFNAAGGILWAIVFGLLGYELGHNLALLHRIERTVGIGSIAVAALVAVVAFVVWRQRRARAAAGGAR